MNLAYRDLRYQWRRFVATGVGLGLLFAVVLAMGGIYRGMVEDATSLIDRVGADFWIVQRDTEGPFAERSTVPPPLELRARGLAGVAWARPFASMTLQPSHRGKHLRLTLVGLSYPEDTGAYLPLRAGRALRRGHREIIVDQNLGIALDEMLRLGDDTYRVVGVGVGLVASGGDALGYVSQNDLASIQRYLAPAALRSAQASQLAPADAGTSAIVVHARSDAARATVHAALLRWDDVSVFTTTEQRDFLLKGVVDKARRQIGLFRLLLAVVSAIVVSLVVFNMTIAKTREIALLKLMGARLSLVLGMIVEQALLLSLLAYAVAVVISVFAFPYFPRRVVVGNDDLLLGLLLAVVLALLASMAAVRRALGIAPTTILAG
ncbi:MAG: hypothetical protein RL385_1617 [Pseudomonadota bacterium]|jgi:putative ABC transport system permease protein